MPQVGFWIALSLGILCTVIEILSERCAEKRRRETIEWFTSSRK